MMDSKNQKLCRLRRLMAGVAFLLAAASAVTGAVTRQAAYKGPRLVLSTEYLDLGDGKPGEKVCGRLELTNTGKAPLTYQLSATCGCSELAPRKGQIAPGESQEINIAIRLPAHVGSEQAAHLTVLTNDPYQPVAGCHIVGRCPLPFIVTPRQVDFGELFPEQVAAATAIVEVHDRYGQPMRDATSVRVRRGPSLVKVAAERAGDGALRLRLALSSDMPAGDLYDAIELELEGVEGLMSVPLHARVVEPISVVPSTVFLRIDSQTGECCPADVLVSNRRAGERVRSVSLVMPPAGVVLEDRSAGDASRRRLRLIVSDPQTLAARTELRLMFEGSGHQAIVTLVCAQR